MKLVLVICLLVALPAVAAENELSGAPIPASASTAKSASDPEPSTHIQASPTGNASIRKHSETTVNQPPATLTPSDPPSCTDRSSVRFKLSLVRALAELARVAARQ